MARLNYYLMFSFPCFHHFDEDRVVQAYHKILDYLDKCSVSGSFGSAYQAKKYGFFKNIIYLNSFNSFDVRYYSVPDEEYKYLKDFYSFCKHANLPFITYSDFLARFNTLVVSKPSYFAINNPSTLPSPLPDIAFDEKYPF